MPFPARKAALRWIPSSTVTGPFSAPSARLGSKIRERFVLELGTPRPYRRAMKRICILLVLLSLAGTPATRGQDAGTEERLNKLAGQIEDLRAGQDALRKRIEELRKELDSVREQATRPTGNYASQEDLKRLTESLREVDRKRLEDAEKIHGELLKLGKTLAAPPPARKSPTPASVKSGDSEKPAKPEEGFEYVVQRGDTLSVIVKAYRDKGVKISTQQIINANPGLKPERLREGQKIFIPAPTS